MSNIRFVFYKDSRIKVIDMLEVKELYQSLMDDGWVHTKTLNTSTFIENLFNECEEEDIINKINYLSEK